MAFFYQNFSLLQLKFFISHKNPDYNKKKLLLLFLPLINFNNDLSFS